MIPIGRTLLMYAILFLLLRAGGKRTLAEVTVFDFITLLVMSEATQQALTGNDFSVTNAALIVLTLVAANRTLDWVSHRSERIDRILNDQPIVLVKEGELEQGPMDEHEVGIDDLLENARAQGLSRLAQIRYAVLERNGKISIIPFGND
jgi:uncharacterized membrane protein YcaP (DUF421 family)